MAAVARTRVVSPDLRHAYAACRRAHRRHDPTYYYATRRLPAEVRPAVHALYAFVQGGRRAGGRTRARRARPRRGAPRSTGWRATCRRASPTAARHRPAVAALADAGARHDLPLDELRHLHGRRCGSTARPVRIASWEELADYMNGSAAAVGRIMAPLLGAPRARARQLRAAWALAFQLTNFIRDVREDFELDRIYLPGV